MQTAGPVDGTAAAPAAPTSPTPVAPVNPEKAQQNRLRFRR